MTSTALRIQPRPEEQVSRLDHIRSLIKPQYQANAFTPVRGNPVFYRACRGNAGRCTAPASANIPLCDMHTRKIRQNLPADQRQGILTPQQIEDFLGNPALDLPNIHNRTHDMTLDLSDLQEPLRSEMKLFIQLTDEGTTFISMNKLQRIFRLFAEQRLRSIYDLGEHSEDEIVADNLRLPDTSKLASSVPYLHEIARRMMRQLAFPISRLPLSERNSWRMEDMGLSMREGHVSHSNIKMSFQIEWLKEASIRYLRYMALQRQHQHSTMVKRSTSIRKFEAYLLTLPASSRPTGMGQLRRAHLDGFMEFLRTPEANAAGEKFKEHLTNMRKFFDTWRDLGWTPALDSSVQLRLREARTLVTTPLPKPLEAGILKQVMSDEFLDVQTPWLRRMLIIARYHGLRPSSLSSLAFDRIRYNGENGTLPVLRYTNTKSRREAEQPIYQQKVMDAIREQQAEVRSRWPGGSPWLFPATRRNADGRMAQSDTNMQSAIRGCTEKKEILDQAGKPFRLTWYSFRDTVATEMLNRNLPPAQVAAWLDHSDISSLDHYCRLHAETIRRSIDEAPPLNIHGEDLRDAYTEGANHDIEALRTLIKTGTTNIQGGLCTLPIRESCDHHMKCLSCSHFATTPMHLPEHLQHLQQAQMMAVVHEQAGKLRQAEKERMVADEIRPIVSMLHTWVKKHPEDVTQLEGWLKDKEGEIIQAIRGGHHAD